jgi:EXLDI family protein
MPNKTIYISEEFLPLLEKASEQHGGNLSSAIVKILQESLEEEMKGEETLVDTDFHDITVVVGQGGCYIKQKFSGRLIARWRAVSASDMNLYVRMYQTKKGRFALHIKTRGSRDIDWNDWKAWKNYKHTEGKELGIWKLEVYDNLDGFKDKIPKEILPIIEKKLKGIFIEELDI